MPSDPEKPHRSEDHQAQEKQPVSPWATAGSVGSELVAAVLVGYFIGSWLDRKLRTGIWLALAGTIAGISLGLYKLVKKTSVGPRPGRR